MCFSVEFHQATLEHVMTAAMADNQVKVVEQLLNRVDLAHGNFGNGEMAGRPLLYQVQWNNRPPPQPPTPFPFLIQ
jgi:hypothetical protein